MNKRALVLLTTLVFILTACVKGNNSTTVTNPNNNQSSTFQASFTPLSAIGPFPSDLYFNGSTTGTLNIPVNCGATSNPANAPTCAMNALNGFGTQSVINSYFTSSVDDTSLNAGDVFVFQVTTDPQTKAITGFVKPLVQGTDYSVGVSAASDSNGTVLNITPLKPLAGGSSYLVVLTNGIKDNEGDAAAPSADYSAILAADAPALAASCDPTKIDATQLPNQDLLPIAQFTLAQLCVAYQVVPNPTSIVLTFSFSTQYTGVTLGTMAATAQPTAQPQGVGIVDTGLTVFQALVAGGQLSPSSTPPPGSTVTEVYAGTVALPYYSAVPSTSDPTAPLTGYWHNNVDGGNTTALTPVPAVTVAQNIIPILVAIPLLPGTCGTTPPVNGWPTVIFQHGITRSREDMLAMASGFGANCVAVVAIDLPLHGVTNTSDPLYEGPYERTFNLPEIPPFFSTASSTIAPSGSYFINLGSLLTSRDNLREAAADLINLTATLPTLVAVNSATNPTVFNTFKSTPIFFVGHSLGAIVGTTFLGVDGNKITAATLANPGGNISQLLQNSVEFAPQINAGLEAEGVVPGTQFYDDFFRNAQAAIEDGDPANYAVQAAANDPIHMIEVVGGLNGTTDTCNLTDQVVPNSSTDLLASLMGLTQVDTSMGGSKFIVRFLAGDHGSILDPSVPSSCLNNATNQYLYGAVTTEMQTEMVSFLLSGGTGISIDNAYPSLPPFIQAP
ncbi:MAG: alpha/beta fold hydrolase [Gammaproteobacteria bacterium]